MATLTGVLTEITPEDLESGRASAQQTEDALKEATTWQMDNFGEDGLMVGYADRRLLHWEKQSPGLASPVVGAPETVLGVVVTPERFAMVWGVGGDSRALAWPDQEKLHNVVEDEEVVEDVWTPTATNQAGDFRIATNGQILAGMRSRGETLLWTDVDLWSVRFIGGELVYQFNKVGSHCGAISRRAMTLVDGRAYWMGHRAFHIYDGFVRSVPSEVGDFVFGDLNRVQASKIACSSRAEFGEIIWYYPSSGSDENDRYVVHNWREGHWAVGRLSRTADVDRGVFPFPVATDPAGALWRHETGSSYPSAVGGGEDLVPFAETGPVELGEGDQVMHVRRSIPDERTIGGVELAFYTRDYPTQEETLHGPFSASQPVDIRFVGRQVRVRIEHQSGIWRFGTPRLDVVPGGLR